jgi:hypothetical protein
MNISGIKKARMYLVGQLLADYNATDIGDIISGNTSIFDTDMG